MLRGRGLSSYFHFLWFCPISWEQRTWHVSFSVFNHRGCSCELRRHVFSFFRQQPPCSALLLFQHRMGDRGICMLDMSLLPWRREPRWPYVIFLKNVLLKHDTQKNAHIISAPLGSCSQTERMYLTSVQVRKQDIVSSSSILHPPFQSPPP